MASSVTLADCSDLARFVREELGGLRARVPRDGAEILAEYRPAELVACMGLSGSTIDSALSNGSGAFSALDQFVVRIPSTFASSERRQTLLAHVAGKAAGELFEVLDGRDTVPCSFVHVEPVLPGGKYHMVLLGFDHPQDGRERSLVWKDGTGMLAGELHFIFEHGTFEKYHRSIRIKRSVGS